MGKRAIVSVAVSIVITASCSGDQGTSADDVAQRGLWGSGSASLNATDTNATIRIRAGDCYGSFGNIAQAIPAGSFALSGVYTQLTGVYPGKVDYSAQFIGTTQGNSMTLTISISSLQLTVGPFSLVHGVSTTWPQCLYP